MTKYRNKRITKVKQKLKERLWDKDRMTESSGVNVHCGKFERKVGYCKWDIPPKNAERKD